MFYYKIRQTLSRLHPHVFLFSVALAARPEKPVPTVRSRPGWRPGSSQRRSGSRLGSLRLGGGGGRGGGPTSGGRGEERVLEGLGGGGGGVEAGYGPRVPCGGGSRRDQADRVAGEQREVLGVQEQGGGHDVGGSPCVGEHQVPSGVQ